MTTAFRSVLLFSLLCLLTVGVAWGQTNQALPPDSQFTDNFGVDSVNLATLGVGINIPIINKPGALPFGYSLSGLSGCAVVAVGTQPNVTKYVECGLALGKVHGGAGNSWLTPQYAAGQWTLSASPSGSQQFCTADSNAPYQLYQNISASAPDGSTYYLPSTDTIAVESGGSSCGTTLNDYTVNGGFHIVATNSLISVSATSPHGEIYGTGSGTYYAKDAFGNQITNNLAAGTFTDTLNTTAVSTSAPAGKKSYTYTDTSSTAQTISQVLGTSTTVKTTFGCTGLTDDSATRQLVSEVDYPDGNNLYLTYEAVTGGYSGRLYQLTLRSGGVVSYSYGAINCTTMQPASLSRTTADGTTTYTLASITGGVTDTVLDPGKNKRVFTFMGPAGGNNSTPLTLTQVQTYQNTGTVASPSWTLLSRVLYCYNGNATSCDTTQAAYPITEKDTYVLYGSMVVNSRVKELYDSYGNVTERDSYDFGASSPTLKTSITYGSWNGSTCAAVGSSIVNLPCEVKTTDNATPANTISDVRHTYGTKGFETTTSVWSGSQWFATRVALANSNGTPQYVRNSLGTQTNYSYAATGSGGCNAILPTGTSVTVGSATLSTGATWDCNMGKLLSATDANSHTSNFTYDLLGRPLSQQDPANLYTLTESYPSATSSTLTDSTYFTTTLTVDGLGRPIRSQTTDGASYDTASTAYAFTTGTNPQWQVSASQPCIATLGPIAPSTISEKQTHSGDPSPRAPPATKRRLPSTTGMPHIPLLMFKPLLALLRPARTIKLFKPNMTGWAA
jgi:YD repeat-containing protein